MEKLSSLLSVELENLEFDDLFKVSSNTLKIMKDLAKVQSKYLDEAFRKFWSSLIGLLTKKQSFKIQRLAIDILFKLLHVKSTKSDDFPQILFSELVKSILKSPALDAKLLAAFSEHYTSQFCDIRYYFYLASRSFLDNGKHLTDSSMHRLLDLLQQSGPVMVSDVTMIHDPATSICAALNSKFHKGAFSHLWITILSYPELIGKVKIKWILENLMDSHIIPGFNNPKLLFDFLKDCFDYGGTIKILSLKSVFTLITQHNLDHPAFFAHFYEMIDSNLLHSKHRNAFFQMAPLFLQSPLVPNYVVASCVKRISRLCLFAPPSSIIWALPFIYNLIKSHAVCREMIHRSCVPETDPFRMKETDPKNSCALESSLWELEQVTMHYHPQVASLAKIFKERMNKPSYRLDEFQDFSYVMLLNQCLDSKSKEVAMKQ